MANKKNTTPSIGESADSGGNGEGPCVKGCLRKCFEGYCQLSVRFPHSSVERLRSNRVFVIMSGK